MITRGHYIGHIVDDLTSIAEQVQTRCALKLYDLPLHLENFYKDLLSILLDINLKNLNEEQSNAPGLDLGDKKSGDAFQITATKTGQKINKTLKAVTDKQVGDYPNIRMLIVIRKQTSYKKLDKVQMKRCGFSKDDIWDFQDVCAKLVTADISKLERIHDLCNRETARVRIELEIPNKDGVFPTNIADLAERIPVPRIGDGKAFYKFITEASGEEELSPKEISDYLKILSGKLSRLPRVTRDAFALMLDRRDGPIGNNWGDGIWVNADKLARIFPSYDIDGDIRILREDGFMDYDEPEHRNISGRFRFYLPDEPHYFLMSLLDFCRQTGMALTKPLVALDFGDF